MFEHLNRREFLSAAAGLAVAGTAIAATPGPRLTCTIGLLADPHHGLAPDADVRLDAFMAAVDARKPDFLINWAISVGASRGQVGSCVSAGIRVSGPAAPWSAT